MKSLNTFGTRLLVVVSVMTVASYLFGAPPGAQPNDPAGEGANAGKPHTGSGSEPRAAGRYAEINGLRMYYEVHGTGLPLVLLHGGLCTIESSFERVLPVLAKNRQVIAIEQQGHGHTADIDRPLTYEQMADDTDALLQTLNIDSADFFGWSDGANVAMQVAIRHPNRLRRLILLGASFDNNDALGPEILGWLATATADDFGPEVRAAYVKAAPEPDHFPVFFTKWKHMQVEFKGVPPEAIQSIKAPVLVMAGDRGGDKPEHAVKLFRHFSEANAQLAVLPGTSHFALMEHPEWVLSLMVPFLDPPQAAAEASEIKK